MVLSSQSIALSQGSLEERFSHLLQPIRDLAKNWDVDIAHFLEEYLEDLEKVQITFNDGAATMNFSEAALLIQGSAGVYAKKVEYLYSLVYQVLDLITQKKKARSAENDGGEDDGETNNEDDQFLPLDDIPGGDESYLVERDASTNKSVRVVPEMPTRLIPLEESEKGDNILYNKKGEVIGNFCDFNIDTGYTSTDAVILLERGDAIFLTPSAPVANGHGLKPFIAEEPGITTEGWAEDTGVNIGELDGMDGGDLEEDVIIGDGGDADQVCPGNSPEPTDQNGRRSQRKVTFARPAAKPKPTVDPWSLLDPHKPSKAVEKPLVKKKPFKIPAGLTGASTKKRKLKKETKELPPLHEILAKAFSNRSKFPKIPFKVPEFPELGEAFWEEYKLREAIKKEEIKMLKKEEKEELLKEEHWEEEGEEADGLEEPLDDDNDFGDDDIPRLQLDPDLFGQSVVSLRRTTGSIDTGFQTGSCENLTLGYEDLVQKYVERFWASAAEYAQITDLSRRVAEWEEKIRPQLEEEESHETFDIHTYGTFVIERCVRGQPIAFKDIVCGKKEFEVCRYTLATLQLANVYNVELSLRPGQSGSIMDCLYVTLLSTKRHFEDLEEYRAPSITNT